MKKKGSNIKRRDFLKGSIALGTAGAITGLSGVGSKPVSASTGVSCGGDTRYQKFGFETPPAPIPESSIKEKKKADVVILGAGLSGLCAAIGAKKKGAQVILLEKRKSFTAHGGWNAAIGDRLHNAQDNNAPKDQVMTDLMRFGAYHPNAKLIKLWMDENARIMNNLMDIADASGVKYATDLDNKTHWPYTEFPLAINFLPGMNFTLLRMLEKYAKKLGVEIQYKTPAVQLVRKNMKGKVTGVIGRNENGYIHVDAKKGVIICTGGYGNNKDMLAKYSPRALKIVNNQYAERSNTGDGIMMGMWVGAAKQDTDCPMLWDGMATKKGIFMNLARQPFLNVNVLGERYANEDAPFGYTANQDQRQPEAKKWTVWDANWERDKDKLEGTVCENMNIPMFWNSRSYARWKKRGHIVESNTIEGLAAKMNVPKDALVATVKRYNALAQKGVDEDFGKDPKKLTSIIKPPFGACKTGTGLLVTLDGLRINTDLQVLDQNEKPIPGLYAAGNASGDFFTNDYAITCSGISHGRAYTFGWLAGEQVASLKG